ncbi:lysozyme 2-like [Amphiura filiformis]|uniref:lysozyme 2-like n=1 Tax=Amphiura filiformis TaxID=82378 RepID=UPI003B21178F
MYLLLGLVLGIMLWSAHLGESCWAPDSTQSCFEAAAITNQCLACICQVESGCDTSRGCTANKCGPYQITSAYWAAGGSIGADWETCTGVPDKTCAEDTIKCYLGQHVGALIVHHGRLLTCEDWVRVHHAGGLDGMNSASADAYWRSVQAAGCS